jgi:hypothetical protein
MKKACENCIFHEEYFDIGSDDVAYFEGCHCTNDDDADSFNQHIKSCSDHGYDENVEECPFFKARDI